MSALGRFTTYVDGDTLPASDLNGDFDQLYKALNGTTGYEILITSGSTPTLTVDNTGTGDIAAFTVSGVTKSRINEAGLYESDVATGTAPLVVASTTMVANLNAASVGGIAAASVARLDANNEYVKAAYEEQYSHDATATHLWKNTVKDAAVEAGAWFRALHTAATLKFSESVDGSAWGDIFRFNGATEKAQIYQGYAGDAWENLASEAYVDARLTTLSFGAFYEGALATSTKQPRYIVPADIENGDITKVYCTYQSGTVTDDSTITLYHYDAAGVEQANAVVTLASGQATGVATATDITDMALTAGDQLAWVCSAANGHAEVTIWAQGTQEVI